MKRVELAGGAPVLVTALGSGVGYSASWGQDGNIVYSSIMGDALYQVPAAGGEPRPILRPDRTQGEVAYGWPVHLPDGRLIFLGRVLEQVPTAAGALEARRSWLMLARPGEKATKVLSVGSKVQFTAPDRSRRVQRAWRPC